MVKKKRTQNKDDKDDKDEDDDGGDTGDAGGDDGSGGGSGLTPNYLDLLGLNNDEKQITDLAAQALFEQRISVKGKGFDVTALSKMQKLRNKLQDPSSDPSLGGSSIALEEHPELADMGGDVDPNTIVLPESEAAERASNDPALELKLRQRMAAKFGVSQDLSLQTALEEKMKLEKRARPRPENEPESPRYRFVPPKPRI